MLKIESNAIFVKGALIGNNLEYKENVKFILEKGIIKDIIFNSDQKDVEESNIFQKEILLPGFINSHTHIGDYGGLDKAWNKTLEESVGTNGLKYKYMSSPEIKNIINDGFQLLNKFGVFGFIDFREQGKIGAQLLNEIHSLHENIELRLMARPESRSESEIKEEITFLTNNGYDIGLNRPYDFDNNSLKVIRKICSKNNKFLGVHLAEDKNLDKISKEKYNQTDFSRAINYLKPNFIVHATNLTRKQWTLLPDETLAILCPRSNFYFSAGISPIKYCLNHEIKFALGTDNFMAINPSPIQELQYSIWTNRLNTDYQNFINLLKSITTTPAKFFKFKIGILDIGKKMCANLFDNSFSEFKHSEWWNNIIFRANNYHFTPISTI